MASPLAYLNGQWLPLAEARVPVLDRGFLFADGVYEVVAAYGGRMLRLDAHLDRLDRSLAALRIANPHSRGQWRELCARLVREFGSGDSMVYLQVTRGADDKRLHYFPPERVKPTVIGWCQPLPVIDAAMRARGVSAMTAPDLRWGRCDIKSIALLPNLLAAQRAREEQHNEAILLREGRVTEGTSSNIYLVVDGRVVTAPKGPEILGGITRDLLLELLAAEGIAVEERSPLASELNRAEELWLTSSTREVLAITRLDGKPVGCGRPGPLYARVFAAFQDCKKRELGA